MVNIFVGNSNLFFLGMALVRRDASERGWKYIWKDNLENGQWQKCGLTGGAADENGSHLSGNILLKK